MFRVVTPFLLTVLATLPCTADLDLVRNGVPVAQIVVPSSADERVALATEELALYLKRMSGATLTVIPEPAAGPVVINVGAPDANWAAEAQRLDSGFGIERKQQRKRRAKPKVH